MKKAIAMKWAKALESGQYKQTTGALRRLNKEGEHEYCCLGVLCDIIQNEKFWKLESQHHYSLYDDYGILPMKIRRKSGMKTAFGDFADMSLTHLNDQNFSFEYIAQIIRRHWRKL